MVRSATWRSLAGNDLAHVEGPGYGDRADLVGASLSVRTRRLDGAATWKYLD
jgi:hypothetical protein